MTWIIQGFAVVSQLGLLYSIDHRTGPYGERKGRRKEKRENWYLISSWLNLM